MMTDKNGEEAAKRRNEVLSIIRSVCKQLHGETGILEDVVFGCERTLRWNEKANKAFMNENREIYLERYNKGKSDLCLLYTSPSPRDRQKSRMPSSA